MPMVFGVASVRNCLQLMSTSSKPDPVEHRQVFCCHLLGSDNHCRSDVTLDQQSYVFVTKWTQLQDVLDLVDVECEDPTLQQRIP